MTVSTQNEEEWRGRLDAALSKFEELVTQPLADAPEHNSQAPEGDRS